MRERKLHYDEGGSLFVACGQERKWVLSTTIRQRVDCRNCLRVIRADIKVCEELQRSLEEGQ